MLFALQGPMVNDKPACGVTCANHGAALSVERSRAGASVNGASCTLSPPVPVNGCTFYCDLFLSLLLDLSLADGALEILF